MRVRLRKVMLEFSLTVQIEDGSLHYRTESVYLNGSVNDQNSRI